MSRTIAIGIDNFKDIIEYNYFYIDKTDFIRQWWESGDKVTLINRPRRFGKTLNMSMLDYFFSINHADEAALFEKLDIWKNEGYRKLQGTYPVIFLSFAKVKDTDFAGMYSSICLLLYKMLTRYNYIFESSRLSEDQRNIYEMTKEELLNTGQCSLIYDSINLLSELLSIYYEKKVIILLDEYDTPMQEAYVNNFWEEASVFFRSLFNAAFKTNPFMERALITGITRISRESMFSDLNNSKVITTTSTQYATAFGFTEDEVFTAMDEYGMNCREEMKKWYDGFTFGNTTDIYNPWSVINSLKDRKFLPYWVNTSSNNLANTLLREAGEDIKKKLELLIKGESIECVIDEEIVYKQLDSDEDAIWSLLLACGYMKVVRVFKDTAGFKNVEELDMADDIYELKLTNLEVRRMIRTMIKGWFKETKQEYNAFIEALLADDVDAMNEYMNDIALKSFSSFDTAKSAAVKDAPERFYHGFVLGLIVELTGRYEVKSNRESGFGRYDIMLRPTDINNDNAYIIEFKIHRPNREKSMEETVQNAISRIEEKQYKQELTSLGIASEKIKKYGFAFNGKKVLIGKK